VRSARLVVAVALLAGLALILWRCRGTDSSGPPAIVAPAGGSAGPLASGADPLTKAPRWFGQPGVAGRRIAGLVLDTTGAPLPGATVRMASALTMSGQRPEPVVTTDASGAFDFGPQPASTYLVVADAPKLTGAATEIDLRDSTAKPDELRLVLHPCDASIHGFVRDSAGGVVPGALVRRAERLLATRAGAIADASGEYELCLPAGGASVNVTADGYASLDDRAFVWGRTRRDFELAPGTSVTGTVVRADTKVPVEGAIVELHLRNRAPFVASSGADGSFTIDGVPPGRHELSAYADRLSTTDRIEVIAEVEQPAVDVVCELAATVTIAGTVIDRDSRKPVTGVSVGFWNRASTATGWVQAISQADGSFVADRVFPGVYEPRVRWDEDEGERAPITVGDKDVTGVELEVEALATVSGRVTYRGKPVEGAMVRATESRSFATTDHAGDYTLRNVKAGANQLYAQSDRVGAFTNGPTITVTKGERRTHANLELDLAASVAGVVVDQNDKPLAGAYVRFSMLRGQDYGLATTADDGSFSARGMSGGGEYVFEVRQREGSPPFPPVEGKRHAPITVADGATQLTGVRIRVRVERFTIMGRVTDGAGKPVADATLQARPSEDGPRRYFQLPTATSDASGAFTLRDVPAGTYSVQATTARGSATVSDVAAGSTNVSLKLLEAGGIDGTLEGFDPPPAVVAYPADRSMQRRATVSGTSFKLRNLPPGEYRVVARSGERREMVKVSVEPGAIATVTVSTRPLGPVGVIAGTIRTKATGAPMPRIQCGAVSVAGADSSEPSMAMSDARGEFRLEGVPVGAVHVGCADDSVLAQAQVTVTENQVTHVELTADKRATPDDRTGVAGLTLAAPLDEVMVAAIAPGGPAARAGIVVGDVVLRVQEIEIAGLRIDAAGALSLIENSPPGSQVKLALERADKEITVTLTLAEAPR
jgi:protocatechuate 3,4-dioxygenase beta subunit